MSNINEVLSKYPELQNVFKNDSKIMLFISTIVDSKNDIMNELINMYINQKVYNEKLSGRIKELENEQLRIIKEVK